MALKVTIFYNQFNRGWTETWYTNGSSLPSTIPVADYNALDASIKIRGIGTNIYAIRYSVEGGAGNSITFPTKNSFEAVGVNQWNGTSTPPEPVSTTAVYKLIGSNGLRKRIFLRGLQDSDVVRDEQGADVPSAHLNQSVANYFSLAMTAGWSIRQVQTPRNTNISYQSVVSLTPVPGNPNQTTVLFQGEQIFTATPLTFARFAAIPTDDVPGFPRIAPVLATTAAPGPTIIITYRLRGNAAYAPAKMRLIKLAYNYLPFTSNVFERFSEHKTGRPFGSLRGRSRSAVRAI